ncbi:hypothetical protein D3C80_1111440 [compost metagenome]
MPTHIPRDAVAHIVVAVVIPLTLLSSLKITPAPKKPIPVIILAASRSGFPTPIFNEIIVKRQEPKLTSIKVRNPADLLRYSRSTPINSPINTDNIISKTSLPSKACNKLSMGFTSIPTPIYKK